jgi:hypothetical protein
MTTTSDSPIRLISQRRQHQTKVLENLDREIALLSEKRVSLINRIKFADEILELLSGNQSPQSEDSYRLVKSSANGLDMLP